MDWHFVLMCIFVCVCVCVCVCVVCVVCVDTGGGAYGLSYNMEGRGRGVLAQVGDKPREGDSKVDTMLTLHFLIINTERYLNTYC